MEELVVQVAGCLRRSVTLTAFVWVIRSAPDGRLLTGAPGAGPGRRTGLARVFQGDQLTRARQ